MLLFSFFLMHELQGHQEFSDEMRLSQGSTVSSDFSGYVITHVLYLYAVPSP